MSNSATTASAEEVALKLMMYWSDEAKRFFRANAKYNDAVSLDDILCFIGYDDMSLRSRHASDGELEHLAQQAKVFKPIFERGTEIESNLLGFIDDFRRGVPHPILEFVRTTANGAADDQRAIEITKQSAHKWAVSNYEVDITEWGPTALSSEYEGPPIEGTERRIDKATDQVAPPNGAACSNAAVTAEEDILLLTMAWCLDAFMELNVSEWKVKMKKEEKTLYKRWFRGGKLNVLEVVRKISPEFHEEALSARKIHDHISPALNVILHNRYIRRPLRKGEKKAAYQTLFALTSAAVNFAIKRPDSTLERASLMRSPKKCARLLEPVKNSV